MGDGEKIGKKHDTIWTADIRLKLGGRNTDVTHCDPQKLQFGICEGSTTNEWGFDGMPAISGQIIPPFTQWGRKNRFFIGLMAQLGVHPEGSASLAAGPSMGFIFDKDWILEAYLNVGAKGMGENPEVTLPIGLMAYLGPVGLGAEVDPLDRQAVYGIAAFDIGWFFRDKEDDKPVEKSVLPDLRDL